MSLYGLLADIHASDRAPSSCTDSYGEDILNLLWQTVRLSGQYSLTAMIWAGDIVHLKAPSRVSHRLVLRLAEIIEAYPCPVYLLPGNHDIQNDRPESVHETQPLGVLARLPNAHLLTGWEGDGIEWEGESVVYGVPWLQGYGEYTEQSDEAVGNALRSFREDKRWTDGRPTLVVAHAPLYPEGRELKYEFFPARRWAEAMGINDRGDLTGQHGCYYGHVHEPHGEYGFYDAYGGVTFCNNGALSRGSLHEYNLTRQVGLTTWDSRNGKFGFIPLDAKPASEVFRLQEKEAVTDMQGRLDEFLASVGSASLQIVNVESVLEHIRSLSLPDGDAELARDLVEWAATQQK